VDDVQWLDDLSAFLLRSLPGRLVGSAVAWLFTSRARSLPFLAGMADGWPGAPPFARVDLGPLAVGDIVALVADCLGTIPDVATR
jgi:predicted ATPase